MARVTNPGTAFFLFLSAISALPLAAQVTLPPTNQEMFAPLDLPEGTAVRTASGRPGHAYWQQRADYRIQVQLDTTAQRVTGSETITYTNNSPDDLPFLWIQLEQNLFRPGSRGALVNSGTRWRGAFPGGGLDLRRVEVVQGGEKATPRTSIDDTRMRVDLPTPVRANGGKVDVQIDWSFLIPEYGADRMGRYHGTDGWVYEIAQWYPRMYVYDDVNGWSPLPYLGQGEFYLEYGDFDVEITVPHDHIVVAGGTLMNPDEVLTSDERSRIERARSSAETVTIIGPEEVGTAESRPSGNEPLTWKFRLENARDFTWASSRAFIWDASGWEGILLQSAYPREGLGDPDNPGWERSTEYLRHTIPYYSGLWLHFPYPVAVNVAGVVGGMEYPGIVFCSVQSRGRGLFGVTDHEFGHSWFPMIVGSDERRYAWMDEGFNTFQNDYSASDFYGQQATPTTADQIVRQMLQPSSDQPIETYPDFLRRAGWGFMGYDKPGYGLRMLREVVLGHERFDRAFRAYVATWAFKHPQPADFYRMLDDVSGEQLQWFWRGWFRTSDVLDQAVSGVDVGPGVAQIHLSNQGGLVMPVPIEIDLEDGTITRETLPAEVWAPGDDYMLAIAVKSPPVKVTVDPGGILPDVDRSDNTWARPEG